MVAAPNGEAVGWLDPNANGAVVDVGVVAAAGLLNGDGWLPNVNPVFCGADGCPNTVVGVVGCAPKGLGCAGAPKADAF